MFAAPFILNSGLFLLFCVLKWAFISFKMCIAILHIYFHSCFAYASLWKNLGIVWLNADVCVGFRIMHMWFSRLDGKSDKSLHSVPLPLVRRPLLQSRVWTVAQICLSRTLKKKGPFFSQQPQTLNIRDERQTAHGHKKSHSTNSIVAR